MYGPLAYQPTYGMKPQNSASEEEQEKEEQLWKDSPWPQRNAAAFDVLNAFMER